MKVLQVIGTVDLAGGGPVEGLIQQTEAMTQVGWAVDTVSLDPPGVAVDRRLAGRVVQMLGPVTTPFAYTPRLAPWLRRHGADYDVIVVHGLWQYHGYCVAKVARSLGLKYVVFTHGMLDPWFRRRYPLKHFKKWLYWPWGEYRVLRDARLVLFTTEEELQLARRSFRLYRVRERLVGFGIAGRPLPAGSAADEFLAAHPELRGKRILLFLSRIHPKKGCDLLIDAFASVAGANDDLHLVIAGPDGVGWTNELFERARRLGVGSRVTFTGMLVGRIKWGAFDAADAFILPSHQENFGVVLAEALASGLPVLTTFGVNIWREIEADGAGLIRDATPDGTVSLIRDWLGLDDDARQAMRQAALRCFDEHFAMQRAAANLIQALRDVAGEPLPPLHSFDGLRPRALR